MCSAIGKPYGSSSWQCRFQCHHAYCPVLDLKLQCCFTSRYGHYNQHSKYLWSKMAEKTCTAIVTFTWPSKGVSWKKSDLNPRCQTAWPVARPRSLDIANGQHISYNVPKKIPTSYHVVQYYCSCSSVSVTTFQHQLWAFICTFIHIHNLWILPECSFWYL